MRIAHTMLRVSNLVQSIEFYTKVLNMDLLVCKDFPDGKFTIAYVGYGGEFDGALIELTHNWETNEYELGNGFGHIAIYTDDVFAICDRIIASGGNVVRMPGPKKYGSTIIAFATDPDGYKIEFVECEKEIKKSPDEK
ncbi:lactoylglutathione lyase [Xenorhabdus bovienii]|uniref:Lactoylglutathione lyase n=2 Tax=Xenorhabdus bovienii TaxID=40576 RepID=A0A077PNP4_XENBV|nr:lactoylglutathione lyase [Xenorhabdus bovienii]MDE9483817.1 lactoylglutathione lyase [Xenorhabdus bovienii]MDE9552725.1 lactoylglutathione lyase [Xenorhabdus bovienii]CDH22112.1 glyoxalase I, nickel isomerase [Xenorhabdus bovienii str. kraussei Quebec]CDM92140.1 Lactoylglutathione lyase [Xenorhabdus bovienii]